MQYTGNKYYSFLTSLYRSNADVNNALWMKKYMLNQFEFYGIKMTQRRLLCKEFIKQQGFPPKENLEKIIKELWAMPEREYQFFAMELLEKEIKNADPKLIVLLEYLIVNKSWWDTVDFIAAKLVSAFFKKYPEQIDFYVKRWIASENMWLQRTAILFQLKYKKETNLDLLFFCIKKCAASKEFFIRKAIGWALREYSKTDSRKIIAFVKQTSLSGLSKREALKRIK